jgi:hypothetical protein
MKQTILIAIIAITLSTNASKAADAPSIFSTTSISSLHAAKKLTIHIPLQGSNYIDITVTTTGSTWYADVDYYYNGVHYIGHLSGALRISNGKQVIDETTIEASYDNQDDADAFSNGNVISSAVDGINQNL